MARQERASRLTNIQRAASRRTAGAGTRARGFTLIELLVTIAVAGVILTLGVPSMRQVIMNNRMTALTNDLATAVHLARTEAIRRGVPVDVCIGSTQIDSTDSIATGQCNNSGANSGWNQGWLVVADPDSTPELVWSRGPAGDSPVIVTGAAKLTFSARGHLSSPAAGAVFSICDSRGDANATRFEVASTGHAKVSKLAESASDGQSAVCPQTDA